MAKQNAKLDAILKNSAMAFGGGIGAELLSDFIAKQAPDFIAENPKMTEIIPAAAGVGLLYFMPGKMDPLAYGMIGASGAGMADDLVRMMQGYNRLSLQGNADHYSKGREFVEELIQEGFKQNPMNGFAEGSSDGMSDY